MSIVTQDGLKLVMEKGKVFCDSRELAKQFGKLHKNVLAKIDAEINYINEFKDELQSVDINDYFIDASYYLKGRKYRRYFLTFSGYLLIAPNFTGKKASLIRYKITKAISSNNIESLIKDLAIDFNGYSYGDTGYVYIAKTDKNGVYKIGKTKNIKQRKKELKMNVISFFRVKSYSKIETDIHLLLRNNHIKGELYRLNNNEIDSIINKMQKIVYSLTDTIRDYVVHYRNVVEKKYNDGKYYKHYTNLIYKSLDIKLPKGANPRDVLDEKTLARLTALEYDVADMIENLAKKGMHYKEAYNIIKKAIETNSLKNIKNEIKGA